MDPFKEGSRFASQLKSNAPEIKCIVGLGSLHHIKAALLEIGKELPPLILWEPIKEISENETFQQSLDELSTKLTLLYIPHLILRTGDSKSIWKDQILKLIGKTDINSLQVLPFPSYAKLFPLEVAGFREFLKTLSKTPNRINEATKSFFQKIWTQNYFKNVNSLNDNTLQNRYWLSDVKLQNKTIVFLGASPSLEREISKLSIIKDHVIILASDTALQYILSENILPDAVLSFDSGRGTHYHFLPFIPDFIPLITWLGGSPYIFSLANPTFLVNTNFPMDQILEQSLVKSWPELKNPSLNLAGMGRALAILGKAKRLVFGGVSFSDESGKSHCRGTGYESYRLPLLSRKLPWEGINRSQLYKNKTGKNNLAWQKIWENEERLEIQNLSEVSVEAIQAEKKIDRSSPFLWMGGFRGLPELNRRSWERAFQEFPDVLSKSTINRWVKA